MNNIISHLCLFLASILFIMAILFSLGPRDEMIKLREWKETYESGYCPTCGQPLKSLEVTDG